MNHYNSDINDFENGSYFVRITQLMNLLRMKKMTYDFLRMGINTETAEILIIHIVQVLYQTVSVNQDKIHEIKELSQLMGLPFILNQLDLESILKMKSGAALPELLGGAKRMTPAQFIKAMGLKTNKKSTSKRRKSRQRGGAGCNEFCGDNADCNDANCSRCSSKRCVSESMLARSDDMEVVPSENRGIVGAVLRQSTNPEVIDLALRASIAREALVIFQQQSQAAIEERFNMTKQADERFNAALNRADSSVVAANENLERLNKELAVMVKKASDAHDAEFTTILNKLKNELQSLQRKEMGSSALGAFTGITAIKFFAKTVDNLAGGMYTLTYWLLLAAQKGLDSIPFVARVIPQLLDARCLTTPLPSFWNGAIFPTLVQSNNTVTTYDYTWSTAWRDTKYFNMASCPESPWYATVSDCIARTGAELIPTCSVAGISIFSANSDLLYFLIIAGSLLGGLVFYLLYRIATIQTPVTQYETLNAKKKKRRGTDWLAPIRGPVNVVKDTAKATFVATGVGALSLAFLDSSDRSELKSNVTNEEIPFGDAEHPVNRGEFRSSRDAEYTKQIDYKQKVASIEAAKKRVEEAELAAQKLLESTTQNQLEMGKLMIEHRRLEQQALPNIIPQIMNQPSSQMLLTNMPPQARITNLEDTMQIDNEEKSENDDISKRTSKKGGRRKRFVRRSRRRNSRK